MSENKLLLDEHPLVILPALAVAVGLNEAIVLQQMHYWLQKRLNVVEGEAWVYNSVQEWQQQFPFWSYSTVRRVIEKLEGVGLLVTGNFNKLRIDQTKWYRIDYEALDRILGIRRMVNSDNPVVKSDSPLAQNEQMDSSNWADQFANVSRPIPETTTETTTENTHLVGTNVPTLVATPAELATRPTKGRLDPEAEAKRLATNKLSRDATTLIRHFEAVTGKRVKREYGNISAAERRAAKAIVREHGTLEVALARIDTIAQEPTSVRNIVSLKKRLALKAEAV